MGCENGVVPSVTSPIIEVRFAASAAGEAASIARAVGEHAAGDFENIAIFAVTPAGAERLRQACIDAGLPMSGALSTAMVAFLETAGKWLARGDRVDAQRLVTSRFFGASVQTGRESAIAIERDLERTSLPPDVAAALSRLDVLRASAGLSRAEAIKDIGRVLRFEQLLRDDERATFDALYLQALEAQAAPHKSSRGIFIGVLGAEAALRKWSIVSGLQAQDFPRFLREPHAEQELLESLIAHSQRVLLTYAQARDGAADAPASFLGRFADRAPFAPLARTNAVAPVPPLDVAGTAVSARRLQFSASQLKTYDECRRKWFFRYVCGAVEEESSSAATYGKAVHAALERFHGEVTRPHDLEESALRNRLEGAINEAFKRYAKDFGSAIETELARRRALRTAQKYVDWIVARARRRPFEVVACEQEVRLELDGFPFVGYIDRLDRDLESGNVTVIDYKTGVIAGDARSYSDDIANGHDFQLPFYYWAQRSAGERVASLALVPLKDELCAVEPVELEVAPLAGGRPQRGKTGVISIAALERARARMIELCHAIASAQSTHFPPATDAEACRYCSYLASCRERPNTPETKWSR